LLPEELDMRRSSSEESEFPPGCVVWASLQSYPKWPGRVCDLSWIQCDELPKRIPAGKRLVMFFNDDERFSIMECSRLHPYNFEDWKNHKPWCSPDRGITPAAQQADEYMVHWKNRKHGGPMEKGHLSDAPSSLLVPVDQLATDIPEIADDHSEMSGSNMESLLGDSPARPEPEPARRRSKAGKTLPSSARRMAGKTVPLPQKRVTAGSIFKDSEERQIRLEPTQVELPAKAKKVRVKSKSSSDTTGVKEKNEKPRRRKSKTIEHDGLVPKVKSEPKPSDIPESEKIVSPEIKAPVPAIDSVETPDELAPAPDATDVAKAGKSSSDAKVSLLESYSRMSREELIEQLLEATSMIQRLKRKAKARSSKTATGRKKEDVNTENARKVGIARNSSSKRSRSNEIHSPKLENVTVPPENTRPISPKPEPTELDLLASDPAAEPDDVGDPDLDKDSIPRRSSKRRRVAEMQHETATVNLSTLYPTSMAGQAAFDARGSREGKIDASAKPDDGSSPAHGSPIETVHEIEKDLETVHEMENTKVENNDDVVQNNTRLTGSPPGSVAESPSHGDSDSPEINLAAVREVDETEFLAAGRSVTAACITYLAEIKESDIDRERLMKLELAVMHACDKVTSLSVDRDHVRELLSKSGLGKEMVQNVGDIKEHSRDLAKKIKGVVTFWMQLVREGEAEKLDDDGNPGSNEKVDLASVEEFTNLREQITNIFDVYVRQLLHLSPIDVENAEKPTDRAKEIEGAVVQRAFGDDGWTADGQSYYTDMAKFTVKKLHSAFKAMNDGEVDNPYRTAWELLLDDRLSIKSFVNVCQKSKGEAQAWHSKRKSLPGI
jgi:PWWP domain